MAIRARLEKLQSRGMAVRFVHGSSNVKHTDSEHF